MKRHLLLIAATLASSALFAGEYLVKLGEATPGFERRFLSHHGGTLELVSREGRVYKWATPRTDSARSILSGEMTWDTDIEQLESNKVIHIMESPSLIEKRPALIKFLAAHNPPATQPPKMTFPYPDNPAILSPMSVTHGPDPMLAQQWGMAAIGAPQEWQNTAAGKGIIVAVTDSGVDYNHQDLINNMWRNPKEIADDGIDNDSNGYVDDIVGYDFASNDNKPYDLSVSVMDIIMSGGNPGHGTHVSGCVGASLNNNMGIAGVAPNVKIMAVRFINETGQGDTASAIKAIDYAVNNGANIINASWGGESDGQQDEDKLLGEAIKRAEQKGVLFVVAAGNGRPNAAGTGADGYDIDNDPKPTFPAAYKIDNVFGVAAVDSKNNLAAFSNWGTRSIKLAAPGVKVMSSVPGNRYQDTIINLGGQAVTWDGTSMASPHVAGAAAVIWSTNPSMSYKEVAQKLMDLTAPTSSVQGKVTSNGRLDLHGLR